MIIAAESVISRGPELYSADLHDEMVIMSIHNGAYYGVNEVGRFLWERLAAPTTAAALIDAVHDMFEVDADICRTDVLAMLNRMRDEGILQAH